MKPAMKAAILALLITSACACSNQRVASVSHPPSADLTCPLEPDIAAMLAADPTGLTFDVAVREAGQACRDALARVCQWHKDRGATEPKVCRPD
jgi:hypothetical protein